MKGQNTGFTIIEVMLVVTIIGILLAIAIPVYQDYATRARISEGLAFVDPAKKAVSLYYVTNGNLPENNADAGLDNPASMNSAVVESVEVLADGVIRVTLRSSGLNGYTLTLTPQASASLLWACSSNLPAHLLPTSCTPAP